VRAFLIAMAVALSGCGGAVGRTFVLLVTWFALNQPPHSYQTNFNSAATCEAARDAVLRDAQRLAQEFNQGAMVAAATVSAVCVEQ
jgi:hypothetical protein